MKYDKWRNCFLYLVVTESLNLNTAVDSPTLIFICFYSNSHYFGLLKYNLLPFGSTCSPAIFQEVMNNVASDCKSVEIYLNDHNIHSSDIPAHHQRLIALLHWRSQKNITGNTSRCSICV